MFLLNPHLTLINSILFINIPSFSKSQFKVVQGQNQAYFSILNYSLTFTDDPHPGVAIAALMKLSFDEEHRHAMCQLGALQAIASLIQVFQLFPMRF